MHSKSVNYEDVNMLTPFHMTCIKASVHRFDLHVKSDADSITEKQFYEVGRYKRGQCTQRIHGDCFDTS